MPDNVERVVAAKGYGDRAIRELPSAYAPKIHVL
jgi:hypothetical protein